MTNPVMDTHEYRAEHWYELFEDNMLLRFGKVKREYWQIYDAFKSEIELLRIGGIRPWNACFLILNGEDAFVDEPAKQFGGYHEWEKLEVGKSMWMPLSEKERGRISSHAQFSGKVLKIDMHRETKTMHVKRLA